MINKKGFELSFGWLFSIIVGIAFISMAIYAATTLLEIRNEGNSASTAKEFGIILNPLGTGLDEGKVTPIQFRTNTRAYFDCDNLGKFGNQKIGTSVESSIGDAFTKPSLMVSFNNKYIFSSNVVEGEKMIAFTKPLDMPYRVSDLIYIWSENDKFCFIDPPREIEKEIIGLQIKNINVSFDGKCPLNSTEVCFLKTGCDIDVNLVSKTVTKYRRTLYYSDDESSSLIYAAIFADPGIYECQLKRLMKKNSALADIYLSKSFSVSSRGCNSNLEYELGLFSNNTLAFNNTLEIRSIQDAADEIARRNDALDCRLF